MPEPRDGMEQTMSSPEDEPITWHLPPEDAVSPWRRERFVHSTGPIIPLTIQIIEVSPAAYAVAHCDPLPTSGQVAWGCAHCLGFHPVTMPSCPQRTRPSYG